MMHITQFLLARIAEDEVLAQACPTRSWHYDDGLRAAEYSARLKGVSKVVRHKHVWGPEVSISSSADGDWTARDMKHIAEHDPARVLAECEAKRRIVYRYENTTFDDWAEPDREYQNWVLPLLALPYSEHPDYREEWRP